MYNIKQKLMDLVISRVNISENDYKINRQLTEWDRQPDYARKIYKSTN